MNDIRAIWTRDDQWWIGGPPDLTLLFSSARELAALAGQVRALAGQYPGLQGFGAISYEAGSGVAGAAPGAGFLYLYYQPDAHNYPPDTHNYLPDTNGPAERGYSAKSGCPVKSSLLRASPTLASLRQNLLLPAQAAPSRLFSRAHYCQQIGKIHDHLKNGDVYQINYTERFEGPPVSAPLQRWLSALDKRPAPHACYAELPAIAGCPVKTLMSFSPERLIQIRNNRIVTEPIKGSAPRGDSPAQDKQLGETLLRSEKNRAENLMIVDLLRNDLGRICTTGSVNTEKLFELRQFPAIQHLVSTISGELRPDVSPLAALAAVFPGGSITGAPKIKAMEIIHQLESAPRHFYCGSAFSFDARGNLEANILIRTFQQTANRLYCHAGGGIVMDSDSEEEFREMHLKIEPLIEALCAGTENNA